MRHLRIKKGESILSDTLPVLNSEQAGLLGAVMLETLISYYNDKIFFGCGLVPNVRLLLRGIGIFELLLRFEHQFLGAAIVRVFFKLKINRYGHVNASLGQGLAQQGFRLAGMHDGVAENSHRLGRVVEVQRVFGAEKDVAIKAFFVIIFRLIVEDFVNPLACSLLLVSQLEQFGDRGQCITRADEL